jgi:hypothetical protein
LFRAEDEARLAAEAAGREAIARPYQGTPEEEAAVLLAEGAGASEPQDVAASETDRPSFEGDLGGVGDVGEPLASEQESFLAAEIGSAEIGSAGGTEIPSGDGGFTAAVGEAPEFVTPESGGDHDAEPHDLEPEAEPTGETEPVAESGLTADDPGDRSAQGDAATPVGEPEDQEVGGSVAPTPSVDELFAKIRAGRGNDGGGDGGSDAPAGTSVAETEEPATGNPMVDRRDELVGPLITALSRRLKRTLQDDQNDLLDRLRNNGSTWSPDLLPDEVEHLDAYSTAALAQLEHAASAGRRFVGDESEGGPLTEHVVGVAHDLATAIVGPLRRRLTDDAGLNAGDESVVAEHVGAAFREWKGARIERLAGDYVIAGFSAGSVAGSSQDIEWIAAAAPGATPCPDCDDNALNGPQPAGQEFPTGHRHPPAHSGCRCLLAPSAT